MDLDLSRYFICPNCMKRVFIFANLPLPDECPYCGTPPPLNFSEAAKNEYEKSQRAYKINEGIEKSKGICLITIAIIIIIVLLKFFNG